MGEAAEKLAAGNPFAVAEVSPETQLSVERFIYRQAEILDEKQWDDWLALFAEDGHYWMPAEADQTDGDGVPNALDEWEQAIPAHSLEGFPFLKQSAHERNTSRPCPE